MRRKYTAALEDAIEKYEEYIKILRTTLININDHVRFDEAIDVNFICKIIEDALYKTGEK